MFAYFPRFCLLFIKLFISNVPKPYFLLFKFIICLCLWVDEVNPPNLLFILASLFLYYHINYSVSFLDSTKISSGIFIGIPLNL